jgi:hypothetical protein
MGARSARARNAAKNPLIKQAGLENTKHKTALSPICNMGDRRNLVTKGTIKNFTKEMTIHA